MLIFDLVKFVQYSRLTPYIKHHFVTVIFLQAEPSKLGTKEIERNAVVKPQHRGRVWSHIVSDA